MDVEGEAGSKSVVVCFPYKELAHLTIYPTVSLRLGSLYVVLYAIDYH
jgi:hypothetical protein